MFFWQWAPMQGGTSGPCVTVTHRVHATHPVSGHDFPRNIRYPRVRRAKKNRRNYKVATDSKGVRTHAMYSMIAKPKKTPIPTESCVGWRGESLSISSQC